MGKRDLVAADGGVDVDENPEQQENLNAALILGESLIAVQVLEEGGSFVLKLYDAYSRYTADILQLLCRHFKLSTLFKPVTSRPANAERYFVGLGFTGLHIEKRALQDLYTILTLSAKGKQAKKVSSFLPKPPQIITDFVARLNDWHSQNQISYLTWATTVDAALAADKNAKLNYPISYALSRYYDIVGVPYRRPNVPFELPSTPCQEIKLQGYIAQVSREIREEKEELSDLLFPWMRYSLSHGEENPLTVDDELLREWCNVPGPERKAREELRAILLRPRELEEEECTSLTFKLHTDGQKRFIRAEGTAPTLYGTMKVVKSVFYNFLTPRERGKKKPHQLNDFIERPQMLERSFVLLQRYEALRLDEEAYKITYPKRIDFDLYATLLTRSSDTFYSPVRSLEAPFGAVGAPLATSITEGEPPTGTTLSLNLLYATEYKLREELLAKALRLVKKGCTLYVATLTGVPVLDRSPYKHGQPITLEKEKVVQSVYGNVLDKRVLLYTLLPAKASRNDSKVVEEERDTEEEEAEEYEKPLSPPIKRKAKETKPSGIIKHKGKTPALD